VRCNGGNARIGRELLGMARAVGLKNVQVRLEIQLQRGKRVAEVTLQHIQGRLEPGEAAEVPALLQSLRDFRRDPEALLSVAPTFQVAGQV
jgi:hypothetical protein